MTKDNPLQLNQSLWLPLLADAASVGVVLIGLFLVGDLFAPPSTRGGQIIFFAFFGLGFVINLLKRLEPLGSNQNRLFNWDVSWAGAGAIPYWGLLLIAVFLVIQASLNAIVSDFLDLYNAPGEVNEGELGIYVMFGPTFVWCIAAAFFYAGLIVPTDRFVPRSETRHGLIQFFGIFFSNLTAGMFGVVIWLGLIRPTFGISPFMGGILLGCILVVLFISIRLRHIEKNGLMTLQYSYVVAMGLMGLIITFISI